MKNLLDRLENVSAPRSRKLSEASAFDGPLDKFINGGATDETGKLLAKFMKSNRNLEVSLDDQECDMYAYNAIVPLKHNLQIMIQMRMGSDGDASIGSAMLMKEGTNRPIVDLDDDDTVKLLRALNGM
jgi:hypothetical protein